jgi:hypothetical protein
MTNLNTTTTTNATETPSAPPKRRFGAKLAKLTGGGKPVSVKAGPVKPADFRTLQDVCPELVMGPYQVVDGVPTPWVDKNGVPASLFWDRDGIVGTKGEVRVTRANVLWTRGMSAFVLETFKGHNRDSTKPGVERYKAAMNLPNSSNKAWHNVGNYIAFTFVKGQATFDGVNVQKIAGDANGRHSMTAHVASNRETILMNVVFGIPEEYANLADVNIVRQAKDAINRLHRYDSFADVGKLTEYLGEQPPFALLAADIKTLSEWHTKALRVLWCLVNHKVSIKDSTPLPPADVVEFDYGYGDLLQPVMLDVYLLNKRAGHPNKSGKLIPGGLNLRCQLSHVASAITAVAAVGVPGAYSLDDDILEACFDFFIELVDEKIDDENLPSVCLRQCCDTFKLNGMSNQHVKFTVLQVALLAHLDICENGQTDIDYDVESLLAYAVGKGESADRVYFDTPLDFERVEETKPVEKTDDDDTEEFSDADEE